MTKSEKTKYFILSIVAFIGFYLWRVFEASKTLKFSVPLIGGVKNFSLKGGFVSWTQNIYITNGDFTPIPIRSVSVINYIGGIESGTSILEAPFIISGKSTSTMSLKVQIPFESSIGGIISIINQIKSGSLSITFKGEINSVGVNLPLNETFKITLPKL
jgi:LEA14-like dessication related protein